MHAGQTRSETLSGLCPVDRDEAKHCQDERPQEDLMGPLLLVFPLLLGFGPAPTLVESDDVRLPLGGPQLRRLEAGRPPLQIGQASLIMDLASDRKSVV